MRTVWVLQSMRLSPRIEMRLYLFGQHKAVAFLGVLGSDRDGCLKDRAFSWYQCSRFPVHVRDNEQISVVRHEALAGAGRTYLVGPYGPGKVGGWNKSY